MIPVALLTATLLTACTTTQQEGEPALPKLPENQTMGVTKPEQVALSPLATPQEVLQSVDVGRRDPFAAVLTPRLVPSPSGAGQRLQPASLEPPKGLVFQGVLEGARGREALVEYAPSGTGAGVVRSGSLRVGDEGSARSESLLPPGWRVRSIDVARGRLELQAGNQAITLEL